MLPTDAGSRVGVIFLPVADNKAEMHFIINGEDQGVCVNDVPYKGIFDQKFEFKFTIYLIHVFRW